jgi:demethylmenaquinone methyltransferase/2-methoxy-6-polyprenyl-1,4-benzoquinol methylase
MPEAAAPAKGTRPEGAVTEADASQKVREMFTQIAPRYDLLNHLLSLQLDRLWRARVAKRLRLILDRPESLVLDLCCGTGDLSFALAHNSNARIIGADFAHTMLVRAKQKSSALHATLSTEKNSTGKISAGKSAAQKIATADYSAETRPANTGSATTGSATTGSATTANPGSAIASSDASRHSNAPARTPIPFFEADALRLPFADQSFDLVTTAFGFRNLSNYESGLKEIHRVLKPGGTIAILEFTEPPAGLLGNLYRWYFRNVLPRIGALISGDSAAYTYLPKSVSRFFRPPELAALMSSVGYHSVSFESWTLGTVALHTATRPR